MRLAFFSGEHSHDDVQSVARHLLVHSKGDDHRHLHSFLHAATVAVRDEIRVLPHPLQGLVPSFEHVLDLVRHVAELQGGPLAEPIERVLLCVLKIGAIIGHFEISPPTYNFHEAGTCLLGLGIGVLVGAAVSLSPSIGELSARGVEAVRLAFRCAMCVDRVARTLDTFDHESYHKNWIYVLLNENEQRVRDELEKAQPSRTTPSTGKIYVCNARPHGVSVAGPPSRIQRLFEEVPYFKQSTFIRMTCSGGPIHANDVFEEEHISSIAIDSQSTYAPVVPVISPGTGKPFTAVTATDLYKEIIRYLLTEEVSWEKACDYTTQWVKSHQHDVYEVYSFRTAQQVQDVVATINASIEKPQVSSIDMMAWLFTPPMAQTRPSGPLQSKIAIVGMSCRFPGGANDTDQYWDLLESGRDVHERVPADRFNIETHYDPTGKKTNATHTPFGCFVQNPGLFDAAFFNMSPREAEQTDPMQRLALVTAYEALQKAGFVAHKSVDMHRIGTFYGQASDDYREVNSGQDIGTYFISGGCRAFGPGRINYFCGFSGPSFSCDTACSSGLAAIQMACTSLWSGDTDMVVAGGMNILTNPDVFAGLSKGFFLSNTGNCKTWDSKADGYCRADGVGSVVMKRLEDALANNDNILAVVGAAATNHSADAISITHPSSNAQSHLFRQVVSRAGIDPLEVGYVELHGTGTQAGDSNELKSVTDVFAPAKQGRKPKQPLFVGAAKANVGHGEAAAGIMSLVKTLLLFQKESIPPHVGIKHELTTNFPAKSEERNLHIPYKSTPWPKSPQRKRIAIVNNFGAAGGNTTFVLEDGPDSKIEKKDPRSTHVLTISAKNIVSLQQNIRRLLSYIENKPDVALHDLAYTLTARRAHFTHRVSFAISEAKALRKLCEPCLTSDYTVKTVRSQQPPIAFAFTGQGSFYSPMASQLFRDSPTFRAIILRFDKMAQKQGLDSLMPVIDAVQQPGHNFSLVQIHLAIVCVEMALCDFWESLGVRPSIVIGHSVGGIPALYAAKVLSSSDAIFLVGQRAKLLQRLTESGSHGMLAVRASTGVVKKIAAAQGCEIACINGPEDTVLAGPKKSLSLISERLRTDGYKTIMLDLTHGYHSEQMDLISDEYEKLSQTVVFHKPRIPVISTTLCRVVDEKDVFNSHYMMQATRKTVDFMGAIHAAQQSKAIDEKTIWVEMGPHPLCLSFVRNSMEKTGLTRASMRKNEDNWTTLSETLCDLHCAGVEIDWREYHRPYEKDLKLLDLPTYAWNNKNHWIQYEGDWSLIKNNRPVDKPEEIKDLTPKLPPQLQTCSIHGLVEETYDEQLIKLVVETNIRDPKFVEVVHGHAMNGYGVVSSMAHGEIAYTLAKYLHQNFRGDQTDGSLNLQNFEYHEPHVARKSKSKTSDQKQMMRTEAILYSNTNTVFFRWHNVATDHWYASAIITFENSDDWTTDWSRSAHLITSRIESLQQGTVTEHTSKLSKTMVYRLFANLVDWSEIYKGVQTAYLDRMEAYADVKISEVGHDKWFIPPWDMESLVTLSGFVLNGSDVMDTKNNFFITPGFKTSRFAKPLKPGGIYQSYVKMLPTETPNLYAGDVYILESGNIVAVMEKVMYRSWPRIMLQRFFVPPEKKPKSEVLHDATPPPKPASMTNGASTHLTNGVKPTTNGHLTNGHLTNGHLTNGHPTNGHLTNGHLTNGESANATMNGTLTPSAGEGAARPLTNGYHNDEPMVVNGHQNGIDNTVTIPIPRASTNGDHHHSTSAPPSPEAKEIQATKKESKIVTQALDIIADAAGLEVEELKPDANFTDLGVDSLMSLVLAQNFRSQLGVEVRDSIFVEFYNIGDLCRWLETC